MSLPASFKTLGASTVQETRARRRIPGGTRSGILIKVYGPTQSGKTELALSAPDPGVIITVDKQADGVMDNMTPPPTRRPNWGWIDHKIPVAEQDADFKTAWKDFRDKLYQCLANPDANTVITDGDADVWDLQLLADFGRLQKIPPLGRVGTNLARNAMMTRIFNSGKLYIATVKVRPSYETLYETNGQAKKDSSGNDVRAKTGGFEMAGHQDNDYLWHLVIETNIIPAREIPERKVLGKIKPAHIMPQTWSAKLVKCKANAGIQGMVFEGDECNMPSILQAVYPQYTLKDWGYK